MTSDFDDLFSEASQTDDYWTELAIAEFTEELARWMEIRNMSRAELARAIDKTPPYITKVMRGNANFTIASMIKLSRAMGLRLRLHLAPEESQTIWRPWDVLSGEASLDLAGQMKEGITELRSDATNNDVTFGWSAPAA